MDRESKDRRRLTNRISYSAIMTILRKTKKTDTKETRHRNRIVSEILETDTA